MKGRKQSDREDAVGETRFLRTGIDRARPSAECRWLVCGEGAGEEEEEEEEEGRGLCGMNCVGRGFSQSKQGRDRAGFMNRNERGSRSQEQSRFSMKIMR